MNNFLELNKNDGIKLFVHLMQQIGIPNAEQIATSANNVIKNGFDSVIDAIQNKWYESVASGKPNYELYDIDEYLAEVWICYEIYSKKYLKEFQKEKSLPPFGIYSENKNANLIVDLGNGMGMTTAILADLFPAATVIGTNVPNSKQYEMAKILAEKYKFGMVATVQEIGQSADLVFASEYFEHFEDPITHLIEIIENLRPRRMLIANTFNGDAIGHFNEYIYGTQKVNGKQMGRLFNATLRSLGYKKIQTKLWNNRPAYWKLDE